jgi:monoamine oxidase
MFNPEIRNHTSPKQILDVLIIGGGLSGLMVAHEIHRIYPSASWKLLEARPILGGRLANDVQGQSIDLGGAWIWPQQQPFMRKLTSTLNITTLVQPDDPSSMRIDGGAVTFIHELAKKLPQDRIILNSPVTACSLKADVADNYQQHDQRECEIVEATNNNVKKNQAMVIHVQTKTETLVAKRVVIAVPPKIASLHMQFQPPLSLDKQRAMSDSSTWMAGVTKVSLIYLTNFWTSDSSNLGFPNRGGSVAPAFQVYDASTKDGSVAALTFFALVPPKSPAITDDTVLADQVASQMEQMWKYFRMPFASKAKSYTGICVKRWPEEPYIAEDPEPTAVRPHPHPVRALSTNEWNDQLLFAGSESDRMSPGVMEGAVSAAMRVVNALQDILRGGK